MRLVILETPFRASKTRTQQENEAYARYCMRDCISRGEAPFASHLLYTQPGVLDDEDPAERGLGISVGHEWYRAVEACVCYVDHGVTVGMSAGMMVARAAGIPIEKRRLHQS